MKYLFSIIAPFAVLLFGLTGCRDSVNRAQNSTSQSSQSSHEHAPPHGGTAVVLGREAYHREFVLDGPAGALTAYVLDGHMEKFIRLSAPSFIVVAQAGGSDETLIFQAVASSATGETIGDTSQFMTQAEWLKHTREFDAVLMAITIRDRTFTNIAFNFPKGNDR
ncbi:MAG: hypothetical protein L0Z50_16630 [Verrucomicrobiales bacterium]|nr:hypothetical protein [Verrucomicrobiales bacterium]